MMTYKALIQLQEEVLPDGNSMLKKLISLGIVPVNVHTKFEMYKYYLIELDNNRKQRDCVLQSISNTADKFNVCDKTVKRAIKFNQQQ